MDGYAARWAEVSDAAESPVRLPVADDIPAGRTDVVPLAPGTVQRIMTGAPLPAGADVVVPVELTDGGTDVVEIRDALARRQPPPGRRRGHRRGRGRPVRRLARWAPRSSAWRPPSGVTTLPVRRRPRVLVLSTGSELVAPGRAAAAGADLRVELRSCWSPRSRRPAARPAGCTSCPTTSTSSSPPCAAELAGADLLITSGGVSAGAYEVVKDAFRGLGTVEFTKVAMQPGGPQGAGTVDGVPVVTLPGNPVSSFVSFEVFVRPALRRALGHASPDRLRVPARLAGAAHAPPRASGSSCAAATTAARSPRSAAPARTWSPTSRAPTAWSSSPRTSPNCPPAPRSTSC